MRSGPIAVIRYARNVLLALGQQCGCQHFSHNKDATDNSCQHDMCTRLLAPVGTQPSGLAAAGWDTEISSEVQEDLDSAESVAGDIMRASGKCSTAAVLLREFLEVRKVLVMGSGTV